MRLDAHSPRSFPFKCKRRGCQTPLLRDPAHRERMKAELAALKADKSVAGKRKYAAAIALHCDAHGQQMPFQTPVTELQPMRSLTVDLLHGLDLNLPKVAMKYTLMDPKVLTLDHREALASFFEMIGCPLDVRDKEHRDKSKKWFHGAVWHYDFVRGANHKSFGLYSNIFQMCMIVYCIDSSAQSISSSQSQSSSSSAPSSGSKRPRGVVDDFSDDEGDEDDAGDDECDMGSSEIMAELRAFFGLNAETVRDILKLWNAYADLYNAVCDE